MTTHTDPKRGHIVVELPHRAGRDIGDRPSIVGVDLGRHLHLTTSGGTYLAASDAAELARLLTWWAGRRHDDVRDELEVAEEVTDLFGLLREEAEEAQNRPQTAREHPSGPEGAADAPKPAERRTAIQEDA